MFQWLNKLKFWKQSKSQNVIKQEPVICDYGQYVHKPVVARALSVVLDVSQSEICNWIADPNTEVFLNDELLVGAQWARRRLESGSYEVRIPSQDKIWTFFIA